MACSRAVLSVTLAEPDHTNPSHTPRIIFLTRATTNMPFKSLLTSAALAVLLSACAQPTAPPSIQNTLIQHGWQLQHATNSSGQALAELPAGLEAPVVLRFDHDALSVNGGCNNQFGPYRITAHTLQIKNLAATLMACPDALMQRDHALAAHLQGDLDLRIEQDDADTWLALTTRQGDRLRFKAIPTPR